MITTMNNDVSNKLNARKQLKQQAHDLKKQLMEMVGLETYQYVTSNQNKLTLASFILADVKEEIERTDDIEVVLLVANESSRLYSFTDVDFYQEFESVNSIATLIEKFITDTDLANQKLLGDNLDNYMKVFDERQQVLSQEAVIKLQLNSTYGRR